MSKMLWDIWMTWSLQIPSNHSLSLARHHISQAHLYHKFPDGSKILYMAESLLEERCRWWFILFIRYLRQTSIRWVVDECIIASLFWVAGMMSCSFFQSFLAWSGNWLHWQKTITVIFSYWLIWVGGELWNYGLTLSFCLFWFCLSLFIQIDCWCTNLEFDVVMGCSHFKVKVFAVSAWEGNMILHSAVVKLLVCIEIWIQWICS